MALRFFAAQFLTGDLYPTELPLSGVTMGGSLEGGEFRASLDLRKLVDPGDWAGAVAVRDMLAPGVCSIVAVLDEMWAGEGQPLQAHVHGEWLVTNARRDFASPIVQITGVQPAGYLKHRVLDRRWTETDTDSVALVRRLVTECFRSGQTIAVTPQTWVSALGRKITVDWPAGSITYWDACQKVMGDNWFEWTIHSRPLAYTGGIPPRAERLLQIGEPKLWYARPDIVLEAVTPGSTPAGVMSLTDEDPLTARAFEAYAFGAGFGDDQITARTAIPTPAGYPRLSVMVQARDADTVDAAAREAQRTLGALTPAAHTIEAVVDGDFLPGEGPQVGHVYQWIKEPSLSIPLREEFRVRVVAYEWTPGEDGDRDRYVLTMTREAP